MHSIFSDGELSPQNLVEMAQKKDVAILSLTDHDTFRGIKSFIKAAEPIGITAFPGIEMTVKYRDFNIHLLGYFKNIASIADELSSKVDTMQQLREERMVLLIDKLNEILPPPFIGSIHLENVKKASEGVLGRPHLAREMVRLKIVEDWYEAFDKYLSPYNIEKKNLSAEEAICLIRQSDGIPVVAHPGERQYSLYSPKNGRNFEDVPGMIDELRSFGLLGLECIYPYHEKTGTVDYFLNLAKRFDLVATGSRDFHGFKASQRNSFGSTSIDETFLKRFQEIWG